MSENTYTLKTTITPSLNLKDEILAFDIDTSMSGLVAQRLREEIHFKEDCVRKALIALGWKPPESDLEQARRQV